MGNVIDIDVLLANEIEQQVEGTVIDVADHDRERELVGGAAAFFCSGEDI